jgi:hypothetical protein
LLFHTQAAAASMICCRGLSHLYDFSW